MPVFLFPLPTRQIQNTISYLEGKRAVQKCRLFGLTYLTIDYNCFRFGKC